jgi:hypothetical protein
MQRAYSGMIALVIADHLVCTSLIIIRSSADHECHHRRCVVREAGLSNQ